MLKHKFKTVDEYIASFAPQQQKTLNQMRNIIRKAAHKASEVISYNMPAYKQNGTLVYFAMAKNHIGFYPTPSAIEHFKDELKNFTTSKGAVQLPLDKPLPKELIQKIVLFREQQDTEKLPKNASNDFLFELSAPARRALQNAGIISYKKLASKSEEEILQLHGMGKSSIPKLKSILQKKGLNFKGV
jgi:uncharacterized protein YdhG (YjbR/CyaY superfamily)